LRGGKGLADVFEFELPTDNKQNKQKLKVWLRQGSKVETTKHTGVNC
jgi:hypothetical protein